MMGLRTARRTFVLPIAVAAICVTASTRPAWATGATMTGTVEQHNSDGTTTAVPYVATDNNPTDGIPESISLNGGPQIALTPGQQGEHMLVVNGVTVRVYVHVGTNANDVADDRAIDHPIIFFGGLGNDTFRPGNHGDSAHLGEGDDKMGGSAGDDEGSGGGGDDKMGSESGLTNDPDDSGKDDYQGDGGNDRLGGGSGDDRLSGGPGNDTLRGGADNDTLRDPGSEQGGVPDNDTLEGGTGNDKADILDGNTNVNDKDSFDGGAGTDSVTNDGNDTLAGVP
jgi:Ca2+-binding RTX toxin-like protein